MTMVFTATVKKGSVVIKDVPLPDGEEVEVTIERQAGLYVMSEEEEREVLLGEAEADAGLARPVHEFLAELRAGDALRGRNRRTRSARRGTRKAAVGTTRSRTKSASSRGRGGK
jgi:hypothetical protein